jgi:hypothetical protein
VLAKNCVEGALVPGPNALLQLPVAGLIRIQ